MKDKLQEIYDGLKERLKSPFLISFIAIWSIHNWEFVYALMTFNSDMPYSNRVGFLKAYLRGHDYYELFWYPLIWTFVSMGLYFVGSFLSEGINLVYSKWVRTWLYLVIDTNKLKTEDDYNALEDRRRKLQELVNDLKRKEEDASLKLKTTEQALTNDLAKSKHDHGITIEEKTELEKLNQSRDLEIENAKKDKERSTEAVEKAELLVKMLKVQIDEYEKEKNKFRVIYSKYGAGDEYNEVTKMVSDSILTKGKLNVENTELGGDPIPHKVKELFIQYENAQIVTDIIADESEFIEFDGSSLVAIPTPKSLQKQTWLQNQKKLADIFRGEWILIYSKNGVSNFEVVHIDETGKYFVNSIPTFSLVVTLLNEELINLKKINSKREVHSKESLIINSENLITGKDNVGYTLEYSKKNDSNFLFAMNIHLKDRIRLNNLIQDSSEFSSLKMISKDNVTKVDYYTLIILNGNGILHNQFENFLTANSINYIDYHKI